jgi:molybdate transport system substrate-binding protein
MTRNDSGHPTGSSSFVRNARGVLAPGLGSILCSVLMLAGASTARADDLKVMSTVALSAALDELKPKFEAATGHKLTIVYSVIADLKKRALDGETADVLLLSRGALDDLQGQGKVAPGSITNISSSSAAVAVRAGAAMPDIGTAEGLKSTLLASKSIVYADPAKGGASGVHFAKVLDKLGIADQMRPKTILVPGAQAAEVVAKGDAEIGVAMASEIVPVTGAQFVGPLPGEFKMALIFSGGIGAASSHSTAAHALLEFLAKPANAAVFKSKGMDPA